VIETIKDLPSSFPQDRAVRIVKRTLSAAGIELGDFNRRTWARMPQINSEIELARSRKKEFKEKTEEDIRSLERDREGPRGLRDHPCQGGRRDLPRLKGTR